MKTELHKVKYVDIFNDILMIFMKLSIREVERNVRELSQLVSSFNEQVVDQHSKVETIEDNTQRAKDDVDEVGVQ